MNKEDGLIHVSSGLLAALSGSGLQISVLPKTILALEAVVSGTSFCDLSDIHEKLDQKVKIDVKRESKNKYDEFAVALFFNNVKIGYLPKTKNETIARLLDAGKSFSAELTAKEWAGKWLRLEINVFLED